MCVWTLSDKKNMRPLKHTQLSVYLGVTHSFSAQSHRGRARLIASFERSQGQTGIITVLSAPFPQEIKYSPTESFDVIYAL